MMSAERKCTNSPGVFCYVCGEFAVAKDQRKITEKVQKSYLRYFVVKIGDQDKLWAPHVICKGFQVKFIRWVAGPSRFFKFEAPMIWRETTSCINDCYFCMVKTVGSNAKNKQFIKYPNIPSALCPLAYSSEGPTPSPSFTSEDMDQHMESDAHFPFDDQTKTIQETSPSSSTFNQVELIDLVRNLGLSQVNSEILASRSKENALAPGTIITFFHTRERELWVYFDENKTGNGNFVYCQEIRLLERMGVEEHLFGEWRPFLDCYKRSLKCALLYNGNEYSPVPIGHLIHVKEKYEEIKLALNLLKYQEHKNGKFLLAQHSGYNLAFYVFGTVELKKDIGCKKSGRSVKY